MFLSSTGRAAEYARASRHIRAKNRCCEVKVELAGSRRSIADLKGAIAAAGYGLLARACLTDEIIDLVCSSGFRHR